MRASATRPPVAPPRAFLLGSRSMKGRGSIPARSFLPHLFLQGRGGVSASPQRHLGTSGADTSTSSLPRRPCFVGIGRSPPECGGASRRARSILATLRAAALAVSAALSSPRALRLLVLVRRAAFAPVLSTAARLASPLDSGASRRVSSSVSRAASPSSHACAPPVGPAPQRAAGLEAPQVAARACAAPAVGDEEGAGGVEVEGLDAVQVHPRQHPPAAPPTTPPTPPLQSSALLPHSGMGARRDNGSGLGGPVEDGPVEDRSVSFHGPAAVSAGPWRWRQPRRDKRGEWASEGEVCGDGGGAVKTSAGGEGRARVGGGGGGDLLAAAARAREAADHTSTVALGRPSSVRRARLANCEINRGF